MRKILLTSTGFDNENFKKIFIENIGKPIEEVRVLFIPSAADNADDLKVVHLCFAEIVELGVDLDNITEYNLDRPMSIDELSEFDAVYFTGGSEVKLMQAVSAINYGSVLIEAIDNGLFYIGVSAGSMILTSSVEGNLGIVKGALEPHCEEDVTPCGKLPDDIINLSDNTAVWIFGDEAVIIE
jgi:peptidase E